MEKVYRIQSDNLINIGDKFAKFKSELCPDSIERLPQTFEEVKALWDLPDGIEAEILEDSISLAHLEQPDDTPIVDVNLHELHSKPGLKIVEIPRQAMRLRCVRHRNEENSIKTNMNVPLKYNRYRYIKHSVYDSDKLCDLVPLEEILITVRVYEPFVYKRGEGTKRKPRLSQEFLVFGRQNLTQLRDKIYCHCKFGPFKDISDDFESIKKTEIEQTMSKVDDFGFFFITDTFYNDYRSTNKDHMSEIRDWMKRQSDFGPVQVKSMHNTKFEDLNVRVGFPQVYRHYVNCEHVISFSDIRLLASDDSLKSTDYPLLRCVSSSKNALCMICGIVEATFVVKKNNIHILEPTFMCQNCLISFHYIDGKKVGSFQAFRYFSGLPISH